MKQTTLGEILRKYRLGEYDVGTLLWEAAQNDKDEHFIAIYDCSQLHIIDTSEIQEGASGFFEGSVISITC